jgi:hypothetical protein
LKPVIAKSAPDFSIKDRLNQRVARVLLAASGNADDVLDARLHREPNAYISGGHQHCCGRSTNRHAARNVGLRARLRSTHNMRFQRQVAESPYLLAET